MQATDVQETDITGRDHYIIEQALGHSILTQHRLSNPYRQRSNARDAATILGDRAVETVVQELVSEAVRPRPIQLGRFPSPDDLLPPPLDMEPYYARAEQIVSEALAA